LALLPLGFALPLPLPVARWALTSPFHPCPIRRSSAVCFLWHCPSRTTVIARAQALPGSAPKGARTFLDRLDNAGRDHPVGTPKKS